MSEVDDLSPAKLCHRNWLLWCVLVGCSLLWRSSSVFFGVAAGGLMAIGGFYWLRWSLASVLLDTVNGNTGNYYLSMLLRLLIFAGAIALLIGIGRVSLPALALGLSVVVINFLLLALEKIIKGRIHTS